MRIVFFEVKESEKAYLLQQLPKHRLVFSSAPLNSETAFLAAGADIVSVFIYSNLDESLLANLVDIRCITTRSTGFDHIDIEYCRKKNLPVLNVPYYGENTVAEHTFALILALSRNVHTSYARGLKGDFSIGGLLGFDLKDKTLGIIGTGHIGLHVVRIAKGFGMHVVAHDVHEDLFLSEILHFRYVSFDEVLGSADILTLHVPYNQHTRHLINRYALARIKPGALLINTSRGGIIDNDALIEGLDRGIFSGAGLDVLEGEELIKEESQCLRKPSCQDEAHKLLQNQNLLSRDNVVFTPHIAFYSEEALRRILDTTVRNIRSFEHGAPENDVTAQFS